MDRGFDLKTIGFFSLVSIPYSLKFFVSLNCIAVLISIALIYKNYYSDGKYFLKQI